MPSWEEVLKEISVRQQNGQTALDHIRRDYLKQLHEYTKRNVIAYYSGWLNRPANTPNLSLGDDDMNAFMSVVHKLDRSNGLDLILHTPGGNIAATEQIVRYLWSMFDKDIRVIVPQLAMSAGTMLSCAAKEIYMGEQSNLGPIDPQLGNMPTQAVLDEFEMAIQAVKDDPRSMPVWGVLLSKYHPSFLVECKQAIDLSKEMVGKWLKENMFSEADNKEQLANQVVGYLSDHKLTATHARHVPIDKCLEIGLKVKKLEDDAVLQDLALTVHHAFMHTFSMTNAIKIVENHMGSATVLMGQQRPA